MIKDKRKDYSLTAKEILSKFSTRMTGIFDGEANERLRKFGPNILKKKKKSNVLRLIFSQVNSPFAFILLAAAFLSFIFGATRDGTIILLIVLINSIIGFFQEFKAEKILEKIKKLTTDKAIVIRNGEKKEINSRFLVKGDLVFASAGDNIPADGYLLEGYDLYVNEFIFTGESKPNEKKVGALRKNNPSLGEIDNMVFMGSDVVRGEGIFVVTATGMQTELGRIAHMTEEIKPEETPLQKRMRILSKDIMIIALVIALLAIAVGKFFGVSWYETFLFALALSVSVVPEGLPAALSFALSLGMRSLLKVNVLVKKLVAVETLGSVSVICTDKTGTITKNELMVTKIIFSNVAVDITGSGFVPKGKFLVEGKNPSPKNLAQLRKIFKIGVLCNDAQILKEDGQYKIIGDPTEGAMIVAAKKAFSKTEIFFSGEKKIGEIPFSSERMMMSVIYKNKKTFSYVKGSPDVLINLCSHIDDNGKIRKLTAGDKKKIYHLYDAMSEKALRVLAFAQRDLGSIVEKDYAKNAEKKLVWVGMMGMMDSPRENINHAIDLCRKAKIKLIMITGDYEITAKAIAEKVGLIRPEDGGGKQVINGKTLDKLTNDEIVQRVSGRDLVFARISPEQKLRIISVLKNAGMVIAMTGDGVNDALALKKADIGIAMGKIGTDVAKEAGDMILLDDNLVSIVKAVRGGRTIYQNIKKFIHYVFTSNVSELLTVVLGIIAQIPAPIIPIQILIVDLGTDIFPSLALGIDPEEPGVLKRRPANPQEKLISSRGLKRLLFIGGTMALSAVIAFIWSLKRGGWSWGDSLDPESILYLKSTSATYAVIAMTQMANLLQARSEIFSVFKIGFFKNKFAIISIFISISLLLLFLYLPLCQRYFHLYPIDRLDWLMVLLATVTVFSVEELRKKLLRKKLTKLLLLPKK